MHGAERYGAPRSRVSPQARSPTPDGPPPRQVCYFTLALILSRHALAQASSWVPPPCWPLAPPKAIAPMRSLPAMIGSAPARGKMLLSASSLAFRAGSLSASAWISELGFFIWMAATPFLGLSTEAFSEAPSADTITRRTPAESRTAADPFTP